MKETNLFQFVYLIPYSFNLTFDALASSREGADVGVDTALSGQLVLRQVPVYIYIYIYTRNLCIRNLAIYFIRYLDYIVCDSFAALIFVRNIKKYRKDYLSEVLADVL